MGRLNASDYLGAKWMQGVRWMLYKARLKLGPIFNVIFCCGVMAFVWCLDKRVHIAAPLTIVFFTMTVSMMYFTAMYVIAC